MFDQLVSGQIRISFIRLKRNILLQFLFVCIQIIHPFQIGLQFFEDFYFYFITVLFQDPRT